MDSVPVPGPQMPAVSPDLPSLVPVRISLYLREAQTATLKTACHELNLDMTTVVGMLTNDATRGTWERFAINRSAHVAAALKQDLWAAATGNPRPTHAWVLVERLEPYLDARRRSTPSVLEAGRLRLASIMARYRLAIRDNDWPSLDPEHADPDVAFSPVDYEPWMAHPPDPHLHTSFEPGQEVVTE